MRASSWTTATAAVALVLASADAARAATFSVPPGTLGEVAAVLGVQARVTITVTDPDLARRPSPGVQGNLPLRAALTQALRGTGAEAVFYDSATVRIVRRPTPPPRPAAPERPAEPTDIGEIVVTASKQNMLLDHYPGSAKVVDFDPSRLARSAQAGTAAILESLPTLSSTNLGRGRNKLYVRGVSDSSFNGLSQATVGQYLGDVRLNHNGPDPDLNLYDLARVEVLAGPQGTLYGASSLGGIVRLVPHAPDRSATYATASAGLSSTRFGGVGQDAAAMLNLPLAGGRSAARLVVYGARDAGYIDDPSRGLDDINTGRSYGARLAWRMEDVAGWTVDVGGLFQDIRTADGQYTLRETPPLVRGNVLAQPFRSEYRLAHLTVRRPVWRGELLSTTSLSEHDLISVFDATGSDGSTAPRQFAEMNDILLISHETRLSGGDQRTPWVVGFTSVYNSNQLTRTLGPPAAPAQIAGVSNEQIEVALFGQASRRIGSRLTITAGGRLTVAGTTGELLDAEEELDDNFYGQFRFIPTVAIDWRVTRSLSTYLQYQQGFRAGGFAVSPTGATTEGQKFIADDLNQVELGVRWRNPQRARLSARAALFIVDWAHVQADLVDETGLPYTANIGSGRIYGLDIEARWRPRRDLTLTASAFFNDTYLYGGQEGAGQTRKHTLPNIPRDGVRLEAVWRRELARGVVLTTDASVRYVGKSYLATGSAFDVSQGEYMVGAVGARLDFRRFGVSLDVSNIGDTTANTFGFGNPFGLTRQDQMTPLRPRTVRLGIDTRF